MACEKEELTSSSTMRPDGELGRSEEAMAPLSWAERGESILSYSYGGGSRYMVQRRLERSDAAGAQHDDGSVHLASPTDWEPECDGCRLLRTATRVEASRDASAVFVGPGRNAGSGH